MKLSELKIVKASLPEGTAMQIVDRYIGELEAKEQGRVNDFNAYCKHFGLEPHHLGMTFIFRGRGYRITGLNPAAPKFAVNVIRLPDGKGFRFPHRDILRLLPAPVRAVA